jgi:hypothetical protein
VSDERRDLATMRAQRDEARAEVQRLKNRLRAIADCQEHRCSLCLSCMEAAGVTIRGLAKTA